MRTLTNKKKEKKSNNQNWQNLHNNISYETIL